MRTLQKIPKTYSRGVYTVRKETIEFYSSIFSKILLKGKEMSALVAALLIAIPSGIVVIFLCIYGLQVKVEATYEIGSLYLVYYLLLPCFLAYSLLGFIQSPTKHSQEVIVFAFLFLLCAGFNISFISWFFTNAPQQMRSTFKVLGFACNTSIPAFQSKVLFRTEAQEGVGILIALEHMLTSLMATLILAPLRGQTGSSIKWLWMLARSPALVAFPLVGLILWTDALLSRENPFRMAIYSLYNAYPAISLIAMGCGVGLRIVRGNPHEPLSLTKCIRYSLSIACKKNNVVMVLIKQVVHPSLLFILAVWAGLDAAFQLAIVMLAATPTASSAGILIKALGGNESEQQEITLANYLWYPFIMLGFYALIF